MEVLHSLLDERAVKLDGTFATKDDLFSYVASRSAELGITDDGRALHDALDAREREFATGLMDGFAIPHAKSSAVKRSSIFFVRNASDLDWGTMDGMGVRNVIALLVPEENAGDEHLRIISHLATCLLDEAFRVRLKSLGSAHELVEYIQEKMEEPI